jgi:UPF0755 protein
MRRLLQIITVFIALLVIVGVLAVAGLLILTDGDPASAARAAYWRWTVAGRAADIQTPVGDGSTTVRFVVASGSTTVQIADQLAANGLITDPELFRAYTAANGLDSELEAGTYFLNNAMTVPDIATRLTNSNSSQITFRTLEGWRKEEMADAVDANGLFAFTGADFLATVTNPALLPQEFVAYASIPAGSSLEGFLYPDTYLLPPDITPSGLRDVLLQNFREKVTPQMAADAALQGLTLYDVVTLASIAEREAVHSEEHPNIMSVYRNRLAIGMRLEADPTIQYGFNGSRGSWWPNITRADYSNAVSPYNTYLNDGLPPTPISNPDIAAITAAIYPASTNYYYFRAACDGSNYHEFAATYQEHLQNGCGG